MIRSAFIFILMIFAVPLSAQNGYIWNTSSDNQKEITPIKVDPLTYTTANPSRTQTSSVRVIKFDNSKPLDLNFPNQTVLASTTSCPAHDNDIKVENELFERYKNEFKIAVSDPDGYVKRTLFDIINPKSVLSSLDIRIKSTAISTLIESNTISESMFLPMISQDIIPALKKNRSDATTLLRSNTVEAFCNMFTHTYNIESAAVTAGLINILSSIGLGYGEEILTDAGIDILEDIASSNRLGPFYLDAVVALSKIQGLKSTIALARVLKYGVCPDCVDTGEGIATDMGLISKRATRAQYESYTLFLLAQEGPVGLGLIRDYRLYDTPNMSEAAENTAAELLGREKPHPTADIYQTISSLTIVVQNLAVMTFMPVGGQALEIEEGLAVNYAGDAVPALTKTLPVEQNVLIKVAPQEGLATNAVGNATPALIDNKILTSVEGEFPEISGSDFIPPTNTKPYTGPTGGGGGGRPVDVLIQNPQSIITKIADGKWYQSVDGGQTWRQLIPDSDGSLYTIYKEDPLTHEMKPAFYPYPPNNNPYNVTNSVDEQNNNAVAPAGENKDDKGTKADDQSSDTLSEWYENLYHYYALKRSGQKVPKDMENWINEQIQNYRSEGDSSLSEKQKIALRHVLGPITVSEKDWFVNLHDYSLLKKSGEEIPKDLQDWLDEQKKNYRFLKKNKQYALADALSPEPELGPDTKLGPASLDANWVKMRKKHEVFLKKTYGREPSSSLEANWVEMRKKYEAFLEKTHGKEPSRYSKDEDERTLHEWIQHNRQYRRDGRMLPDREAQLNKIFEKYGLTWDPKDEAWQDRCDELKAFLIANDGWTPSRSETKSKKERALAEWAISQQRNKDVLPEDKRKKLDDLTRYGFAWTPWDEAYSKLIRFLKRNKGRAPSYKIMEEEEHTLYEWLDAQRTEYNLKKLSPEKEEKLKEVPTVNGTWNALMTIWDRQFGKYKDFLIANGRLPDIASASIEEKKIAEWLKIQQAAYRANKLLPRKADAMNSLIPLGHVW